MFRISPSLVAILLGCGPGEEPNTGAAPGNREPSAGVAGHASSAGGNGAGSGGSGLARGGSANAGDVSSPAGSPGQGGDTSAGAGAPAADAPSTLPDADLERLSGCPGVFNPGQILDYSVVMAAADHAAMLADTTYSLAFPAQMSCGNEAPIHVAVERKRSGGATKVGLKVDVNRYATEQTFHGLKKLGFENGVSSGSNADDATARDVLAEYLGWRLMQRAGVISSRAAFVRLRINDSPFMAYVNVEQIDKRFLASRLGEDDGWLYKKSGGDGDGLKTHESDGVANPYEKNFCFWHGGCAVPGPEALLSNLPQWLDIPQLLAFGATNAFISNPDGMFFKDNNYYHYDSPSGRRTYLPWDLDTTMGREVDVLNGGVPGGTRKFADVLFTHWRDDYVAILERLLSRDLTHEVIASEIDQAARVAGTAIDADPALQGTAHEASAQLEAWWLTRRQALTTALQR